MDIRHLRYFVGVCEAGSLSRAADRLHVAQPSLGQQISALETELDTQLFERSRRGMVLTNEGRVFLDHARVVLADVDRAREAVRNANAIPMGAVCLGLPTTVGLMATIPILAVCRSELPNVHLKLIEAYSGTLQEWLQAGRIDIAILYGDAVEVGLKKRALLDDQLAFIAGHGTDVPATFTLEQLENFPLILPGVEHGLRRMVESACAPLHIKLNVVAEIDSLGTVKRAAELGLGCTVLPPMAVAAEVAAGKLKAVPIEGPQMRRRVVLAINETRPGSLAKSRVIEIVERVIADMVAGGAWPAEQLGVMAQQVVHP